MFRIFIASHDSDVEEPDIDDFPPGTGNPDCVSYFEMCHYVEKSDERDNNLLERQYHCPGCNGQKTERARNGINNEGIDHCQESQYSKNIDNLGTAIVFQVEFPRLGSPNLGILSVNPPFDSAFYETARYFVNGPNPEDDDYGRPMGRVGEEIGHFRVGICFTEGESIAENGKFQRLFSNGRTSYFDFF